ncbi:MAG: phosphoesterase [Planctomycetales bacterium]|nr:phosphoesterase [Planctomycetales bacterium]
MVQVETERVLVVPTAVFREIGYFQGFSGDVQRYVPALFDELHTSYRPRAEMEDDPSFKQLIPYVIFRYDDPERGICVFQYTRGKGQGERRLHAKRSVGVGGHISTVEQVGESYDEGMQRELAEEVRIDTPYHGRCVGLINDDETEVGRVHLGVVHIFDVQHPEVHPNEEDILETGFRPAAELLDDVAGFETWSQICLKALF